MKTTHRQRWLSLLLTLAMCLTLAPAAWAAEEKSTFTIKTNHIDYWEPNNSDTFEVAEDADGNTGIPSGKHPIWESTDESVATIDDTGRVMPRSAGKTTIRAYYMDNGERVYSKNEETITVSGLVAEPFEVEENGTKPLSVKSYGNAANYAVTYSVTGGDYFIEVNNLGSGKYEVSGLNIGDGKVTATAGRYYVEFTVTVIADSSTTIEWNTLKSGETLPFSDLTSRFASQIGGQVEYVTGLFVPTDQGTLYYGYRSEAEPGAGVGQSQSYYLNPGPGQQALRNITFVPKPGYVGGTVTITYSAVTGEGRTYSCKITFVVQGGSGDDSQAGGISLTTDYNTAVRFDSTEFSAVCREKLGSQLDHVIFAQPPERQGALYTNYSSSGSYGSLVDVHRQYTRKELDDVWFVPAPGYSNGTVTIYYTGFGTNGRSYSGQVFITVEEEDQVAIGGLSYTVSPGGAVRFDDDDFDEYCWNLLNQEQTISGIRFESLPSESDGILYYDYQSSSNPGSRAVAGTVYYPGTRAPRIDRLVFVASENFTGTLKLPFTGWTTDGTSFSGTLEINVRGSAVSGDIYYYCAPGRSVSFVSSDFTNLSRSITGRTLDYIRFRGLPSTSEGSLYYGNSLIISTGASYTSSNINRLSFRASNRFSGLVNISFEGRSTGGDTFTGVVTIGSGGSGGSGSSSSSGSSRDIHYYTDAKSAAVFYRDDFNDLSLWETDRSISSVRFDPPSSSQGSLYQNYRSSSSMGTKITSSTSITASNLDRVAFVPASGYSGTVYIDFTATASGSGGTFTGAVEITVSPSYSSSYFSDMAGYSSSQLAAVDFLYEHNITHGLTAGYYGPESSIRRGDFALMLYQAFDLNTTTSGGFFADVPSGAYYAAAVNTLYARGVVSGIGGGYYAPDSTLTRQDAICMVQRAMQAVGKSAGDGYAGALAGYADSGSVSGYAQGAMAMAVQRGYLPTTGGWLNPLQPLTRVDMAELLHRALTY